MDSGHPSHVLYSPVDLREVIFFMTFLAGAAKRVGVFEADVTWTST